MERTGESQRIAHRLLAAKGQKNTQTPSIIGIGKAHVRRSGLVEEDRLDDKIDERGLAYSSINLVIHDLGAGCWLTKRLAKLSADISLVAYKWIWFFNIWCNHTAFADVCLVR